MSACTQPPINSRIIGGQDASPGSWPWHVTFTTHGWVSCQGSLITDEWVLTAARCSNYYYLSGATVHLGANNQSGFGEVTRRVDALVCHQDFYNYDNDICLVKLSAPVNFTDYIRPVCLASANSTFYDGTSSWVTGFGDSLDPYYHYYYRPDTLQEVNVPILGDNKCSCFYNNSNYYYNNRAITRNQMCAGSENGSKDAFYGDQGAALVTKHRSIWVQSGIASYVYDHYLDRPSIYTRVSQYEKWIRDRVTGMEPGFVTFTSSGVDSDVNFTCPTPPPTTPHPTYYTHIYTDDSIFSSGETLIPITRFFPLSVPALLLHLFVSSAGM